VISREVYERLNTQEQPTLLQKYKGPTLKSCSEEIQVLGEIVVSNCTISTTINLSQVKMIVVQTLVKYVKLFKKEI